MFTLTQIAVAAVQGAEKVDGLHLELFDKVTKDALARSTPPT